MVPFNILKNRKPLVECAYTSKVNENTKLLSTHFTFSLLTLYEIATLIWCFYFQLWTSLPARLFCRNHIIKTTETGEENSNVVIEKVKWQSDAKK